MKTSFKYIHEFDIVDEFYEESNVILESLNKDVDSYHKFMENADLKAFFENDNMDVIMEKEKEGIVTKLGNAVISIVKKISECITNFINKIFHRGKKIEDDVDIVNRMITEHPEIKNTVVKGIKEEWFTYRDVATYEKDIVQLMIMLDKEQISHKKFKEKVGEKTDKFISSGRKIAMIGGTIASCLLIVPKTLGAYKKCKNAGKDIAETMNKSQKKKSNAVRESANENDSAQVENQRALITEGANAFNIINKYNNLQLSNLEKITAAIKSSAEDSLDDRDNKDDKKEKEGDE